MAARKSSLAALSRRQFISSTIAGSAALAVGNMKLYSATSERPSPPIVIFSKVYQSLKLNFEEAAEVTAEAGLDGIDCPLRPAGEILPENAVGELPVYAGILHKRNLTIPLLTTAITGVSSSRAENILRAAKKSGVQFYRLGFIERAGDVPTQIKQVREQLKPLAELNQQIGIGALIQNHSPSGKAYLGGDLSELREIVSGFDPDRIGVAFDIGHALVVHGEKWRGHFEKLKSYFKIAYVKDVKPGPKWVRFGQGDIGPSGYFKLLREMNYQAPISLHIEFDWTDGGKTKNRAALVKALKESAQILRGWLAQK